MYAFAMDGVSVNTLNKIVPASFDSYTSCTDVFPTNCSLMPEPVYHVSYQQ